MSGYVLANFRNLENLRAPLSTSLGGDHRDVGGELCYDRRYDKWTTVSWEGPREEGGSFLPSAVASAAGTLEGGAPETGAGSGGGHVGGCPGDHRLQHQQHHHYNQPTRKYIG